MMKEYHKIQTVFKRDPATDYKTLLTEFARPEFEYLAKLYWEWTEKVDGMNIRVMHDPVHTPFKFAGKTDKAQLPPMLLNKLRERFGPENDYEKLASICDDAPICLYGEGFGAGIQKGGKYLADGPDFVLFDVKIGEHWLQRDDVEDIAAKLGIPSVPIVGHGTLLEAVEEVEAGVNSQWGNFPAEGYVMRPMTELLARNGQRIIAKIKHKDFGGAG